MSAKNPATSSNLRLGAIAVVVLAVVVGVVALVSGPSGPGGLTGQDADFATRLQGHYGQMVDEQAWPSVADAARRSCDRLTGVNPPPWEANLLPIEGQGGVDEQFADHVARAGVDVYCPAAASEVPAG